MFSHREKRLEPEALKQRYFRSVRVVERQFDRYQWPLYVVFATVCSISFYVWSQLDIALLRRLSVGAELFVNLVVIGALAAASAWIASRPSFDQQAYDFRDEKLSKHLLRCYRYRAQHPDIWSHFRWWKYNGACRREYEFTMGYEESYDDPPDWIT